MSNQSNWQNEWTELSANPSRPPGFGGNLHPGIKSALIVSTIILAISIVNVLTGGSSIILCYPIQLLIYAGNGALGAYFALNSGYPTQAIPRVGAVAGAVAWILPAAFYILGSLVLGVFTFGVGFLGVALWLLCGPVDLAIHVLCAMTGAWLYSRSNRGPSDEGDLPY